MQIVATGKQIDLGDALRVHIGERLEAAVAKYFDNAIEAHVILSREAHLFRCECSIHVGAGIKMQAEATADEIYASVDAATARLDKQLRREKRRRRNHHAGRDLAADGS
jgi:ribosomal subunit interface protein